MKDPAQYLHDNAEVIATDTGPVVRLEEAEAAIAAALADSERYKDRLIRAIRNQAA